MAEMTIMETKAATLEEAIILIISSLVTPGANTLQCNNQDQINSFPK